MKSIGMRKKQKILKKWVINWISFNIFQEVQLGIGITFNYFWLLSFLSLNMTVCTSYLSFV